MLKVLITYYSRSGHTEKIAQKIAQGIEEAGGHAELMPIHLATRRSLLTGLVAAVMGNNIKIKAKITDCSDYDLICFGSPVWAAHPTPAINSYIDACENIAGKNAAIFLTFSSSGENSLQRLEKHLRSHGVNVVARLEYPVGPSNKNLRNHKLQDAVNFGRDLVLQQN